MPFELLRQIQTEDYVTSIIPAPQGPYFFALCSSGSVKVLDSLTLECKSTFNTPSPVSELVFGTPQECVYIGGMDGTISVFDLRTAAAVSRFEAGSAVLSVSKNASGTVLAAGTELLEHSGPDGEDVARLLMWDVRNGAKPLVQFIDCHSEDITQVRFHPSQDNLLISGSTDCLLNLYNISPSLSEEESLYQVIKTNSVNKVGFFDPNLDLVYCQTHIETFSLYLFEEGTTVKEFGDIRSFNIGLGLPAGGFREVEYLVDTVFDQSNGRLYLVAGMRSGDMGILNVSLDKLELVYTLNGGHKDIVRGLNWDVKNGVLVSGGEDGVISMWQNY